MDDENLQEYIYDHIPIVKANLFGIAKDGNDNVCVSGAFKDHINHRNSVFGGSLSTAMILASWATVRNILRARGIANGIIVIQSEEVKFMKPVVGDFIARIKPISDDKLRKFITMLNKFGKARLVLESSIAHANSTEVLTTFSGEFVVVVNRDC